MIFLVKKQKIYNKLLGPASFSGGAASKQEGQKPTPKDPTKLHVKVRFAKQ